MSILCLFPVHIVCLLYPFPICPGAQRPGVGGAAKDTGSALWGPVGQARVGSQPRRKGHSEVGRKAYTPPSCHYPPLPPASKEKGTGGGGGLKPAESAPCCLGLLGGQSRQWHWTHRPPLPASLPTDQFPFLQSSPLRPASPSNQFPPLTG